MRVLFDHQIFATQSRGGISRYFFELAREMGEHTGVSVDLFGGLNITDFDLHSLANERVHVSSVHRPRIPKTARAFGALNATALRAGPGRRHHDIYHPTYFDALPAARGRRVTTVYDMAHERFADIMFPGDPTAAQKRRAVAKSDAVIAISEATKIDLIEILGVPEERISVIHLANSLRARTGLPSPVEGPYILYVGVRYGYKNFERLLRVFDGNPDLNAAYKLVCFGGPEFSASEHSIVDGAGLAERVLRFSGDDTILARMYENASALVYPSLYEGFGLPPLEAMYFHCPVLASRIAPVIEVAGDAAIYFDPTDDADLEAQLTTILSDEDVRSRLRAAGERKEAEYSWARCADETLAFYREVCGW